MEGAPTSPPQKRHALHMQKVQSYFFSDSAHHASHVAVCESPGLFEEHSARPRRAELGHAPIAITSIAIARRRHSGFNNFVYRELVEVFTRQGPPRMLCAHGYEGSSAHL
ncbi:hypothetical protein AB1Y20_022283 [Prymnesium parvum]|uniref:Uncharacterized protein n=1 Tax=Prymnesium parvum TaxID=97485 RepID=A0AB34JGL6_PRYPA